MKIIARDRGTGKTTELVKESARTGQYILASNKSHVRAIEQIAKKAGVTIPYPVTVDEIVSMDRFTCASSIQRDGLLVDEAIMVLSKLIGLKITGATISLEGEQQC
ncbi:replicase [Enterococcus faecalis EnGen0252]|uniref:Replicase domain protein n=2 Tax=Enterococcus faecalis TaxID=1351 RepID=Q835D2_ENTFA|nr:replicase [Enterococcus faecalis]AAO81236.1 replicase domain protein [Enterococcus faecalis V583]EFU87692.1 replicase domain protein [Enterococcus faecalis TX0309B]EFU92249.1 replicase domain protein [Enterococcus faecalis TX0309A]EHK9427375.1 replicase [Enterococcus faecalis]EHL2459264.1 replicase [Enterococcus faecalis]